MSFDPDSLCVLSYARARTQRHGFTHWYYWTDRVKEIFEPGFFDKAADVMRPGDIVYASGLAGAAQICVSRVVPGQEVKGQVYRQGGQIEVKPIAVVHFGNDLPGENERRKTEGVAA